MAAPDLPAGISRRDGRIVEVTFERSPLARFATHAVLLLAAIPIALKASTVARAGLGPLLAFTVVAAAMMAPVALDLWAQVRADERRIRWRNRSMPRSLPWAKVAGFEPGRGCMRLVRTDGRTVALRALGVRYFGSKQMAAQRVAVLERLRRSAG